MESLKHTLVIGFGNIYRQDDGVGTVVVRTLHERIYGKPLPSDEDGYDLLGRQVDLLILHQLVPDLAETIAEYDLVIFVDAHVEQMEEQVREEEISPLYKAGIVTHQLHPSSLLALTKDLYGSEPRCVLLSIRGHWFDFGEGLSPETARAVPQVVSRIFDLAKEEC